MLNNFKFIQVRENNKNKGASSSSGPHVEFIQYMEPFKCCAEEANLGMIISN